jgi:hypothetical protein
MFTASDAEEEPTDICGQVVVLLREKFVEMLGFVPVVGV